MFNSFMCMGLAQAKPNYVVVKHSCPEYMTVNKLSLRVQSEDKVCLNPR